MHSCLSWAGFGTILLNGMTGLAECFDSGQDFLACDDGTISVHLGLLLEQHVFASWLNK
jgi:hypothetical protein